MQAIIDECRNNSLKMTPAVVISNNSNSMALQRAKNEKIPFYHLSARTHPDEKILDEAITYVLIKHKVDIVILAGYMKKIGTQTLNQFRNRIVNIHPALLPEYGGKGMYGMRVHEEVVKNRVKETGITIHIVDEKYDHGRIVNQVKIKVNENETAAELQKRVLEREHSFYVETLKKIASGEIKLYTDNP